LDFLYSVNKISFLKMPVKEIISHLVSKSNGYIKKFYIKLNSFYSDELLDDELKIDDPYLLKKDKEIILSFFKSIGSTHNLNEINNLNCQSENLLLLIKEAKENKEKNQKSKCTLTMCFFIIAVIIFV